ncbi:uncharacterized protein LACBIDRAFT_314711 [Laccaria bicolor S238N-H82]|uniref:Predicted protein n=1 Tax=Laccaria bicolor (strain S238N-H82 / ATCC MYA-4686) TaxID=486041 RepID=B0DZ28_LACBS|nr:uncharacterized protein LACBIDRAFT_314711 [Laccaria bicolor S238N-H82]EDR00161.1 predicted protein [Laccaria bicolor S238N-H82]|eukprot:XP_001889218.1 predicted protein [Laccaria bicolor S238N-H82]
MCHIKIMGRYVSARKLTGFNIKRSKPNVNWMASIPFPGHGSDKTERVDWGERKTNVDSKKILATNEKMTTEETTLNMMVAACQIPRSLPVVRYRRRRQC